LRVSLEPSRRTSSSSSTFATGIEIYCQTGIEREYFDIVPLISGFEDDFVELLDPLSCTCTRIGTKMINSVDSVEIKTPVLFISVIQFDI
jgi:hypothetical protein